jgi:hypothetical protein
MSAGSGIGPGLKMGAAAETVQEQQKTVHKIYAQLKTNVLKIVCCGSSGQLPAEKRKVVDF